MKRQYDNQYKEWRREVLKRYNSQCVKCGGFENIQAHHKKSWANFPELRFDVNNGEAMCLSCHIEIHPFMVKYIEDEKKKLRKRNRNKAVNKKRGKNRSKFKKRPKLSDCSYKNHQFDVDNPNPNWT